MRARPEATPASVAATLLAFYREPIAHRPAFLHSAEGMAGGVHVFRFALGKLPQALLRDLGAADRATLRQAACAFVRQVCFWEGANHYQVLCVARDATLEEVKEHYRLLIGLVHPDRKEPDLETAQPWPAGCGQRVNDAYAVLGDPERREAYDAELRKAAAGGVPPVMSVPPKRRSPRAARRAMRTMVVVCGAMAVLAVAQFQWFGDLGAPEWLPRAAPRASEASGEPRFLGIARAESLLADAIDVPHLASLPPPVAIQAVAKDSPSPHHVAPPAASPAPSRRPSAPVVETPAAAPERDDSAARARPSLAQVASAPQSTAVSPREPELSTKDVELLLAQLVSYYEAGDLDHLMGLFDVRSQGLYRTGQARNVYDAFFRATRQRRLRISNLIWNTAQRTAYARGQAEILADYFDTPSQLDRSVEVEIDIALREGGARITRLSLYPNGP